MIAIAYHHEPLYRQCLNRVIAYAKGKQIRLSTLQAQAIARWVSRRVKQNERRIGKFETPNATVSGVPDQYVDDVIQSFHVEHKKMAALRGGDTETWEQLLCLISTRVGQYLRRYWIGTTELYEMREDLVQICAETFLRCADHFPYDCSLEAWVSKLVANKVRELCRTHGYQLQRVVSLPVDADEQGIWKIHFSGPDESFLAAEARMTLQSMLGELSEDQRLLIELEADGNDVETIARVMSRTPNAIYKLRQRAYAALQVLEIAV
jgi:RNA polymerase sigma factor (sigma-70 family)